MKRVNVIYFHNFETENKHTAAYESIFAITEMIIGDETKWEIANVTIDEARTIAVAVYCGKEKFQELLKALYDIYSKYFWFVG